MKKLSELTTIFFIFVLTLSTIPITHAYTGIVYGDLSDGFVGSISSSNDGDARIFVGDDHSNDYYQGFVKFSLSGISSVDSATLYIYVHNCWRNNVQDITSPLTNPGLGDCIVHHIADYGTLGGGDLDAPSIGNDPVGALIGATETPNVGYVSIDVTAAMKDDIANGRAFSTFMIKLTTNSDGDDRDDLWFFASANNAGMDLDPYIEYSFVGPVGGIYVPINKFTILAPYIALVGLIGVVSMIFAIKRWLKD